MKSRIPVGRVAHEILDWFKIGSTKIPDLNRGLRIECRIRNVMVTQGRSAQVIPD